MNHDKDTSFIWILIALSIIALITAYGISRLNSSVQALEKRIEVLEKKE